MAVQTYEEFREQWVAGALEGASTTVQKGNQFSIKLVGDWLDINADSEDFTACDGSGDGGIDLAVLVRAEGGDSGTDREGDTWYLVQSKYGSAFKGDTTIVQEGLKVIATLDGDREKLNSLASGLLEQIRNFRSKASTVDRIVLVYATVDPLTEAESKACDQILSLGRQELGGIFDVEQISVKTIFDRLNDDVDNGPTTSLTLRMSGGEAQSEVRIGAVSLVNLYHFMKEYRGKTKDLDRLYEKNVRKFLGMKGKVNKGMRETLEQAPERFVLYNNGITIVAKDFVDLSPSLLEIKDPFIVNGCQTSQTIWEICRTKLDSGGTGSAVELDAWKTRAEKSFAVLKVVKVGAEGEALLQAITRFTNTQNAVQEKDFLALHAQLQMWAQELRDSRKVYLEIQRGGWDSERTKATTKAKSKFENWARALDLLKVYCAGWFEVPGPAWSKNSPFLPGGAYFKRVAAEEGFGAEDLWAAFVLLKAAEEFKFGRGAEFQSRRQTKFAFYFVVIRLLREIAGIGTSPEDNKRITRVIAELRNPKNDEAKELVFDTALQVIDDYISNTDNAANSIHNEPAYQLAHQGNLNSYLKAEAFGTSEISPKLRFRIEVARTALLTKRKGEKAPPAALIRSLFGATK